MLIADPGPMLTLQAVDSFEKELGFRLPESYRRFLLLHNGGAPTPDAIDVPGLASSPTDVQIFFGIGRNEQTSSLSWNLALISERCGSIRALQIACDSGGNLFCLSLEREPATEIIYCDLDTSECARHVVAPSFQEFVARLRPFAK